MTDPKSTFYLIPKSSVTCEQTIKHSRFICYIGHADSKDRVFSELEKCAANHPKANHICRAYIAGPPGSSVRGANDDGEPRGTAGQPMLAILEHSGFGEIWTAVIRYFGGIKLGKGGLIRAYTSSVQQALALIEPVEKQPMLQFKLRLDYNLLTLFEPLLEEAGGKIIGRSFTDRVSLELLLPESACEEFSSRVISLSSGTAQLESHEPEN